MNDGPLWEKAAYAFTTRPLLDKKTLRNECVLKCSNTLGATVTLMMLCPETEVGSVQPHGTEGRDVCAAWGAWVHATWREINSLREHRFFGSARR